MPFYEREQKLLNLIVQSGHISVNDLSKKLFISKPTVRRDLLKLEKKGIILRNHGGAELLKKSADETIPFFLREQEQNEAKQQIAAKAAKLISDGDTLMLDGTTSAYCLIPYLSRFQNLIVITTGLKAASLLSSLNIKTICTGGEILSGSFSLIGPEALHTIRHYNADICFFSCRGLSDDGLLTDNSIEENQIRKAMLMQSRKKVLLCDRSKIGHTFLNTLCTLEDIDTVITENAPLPRAESPTL